MSRWVGGLGYGSHQASGRIERCELIDLDYFIRLCVFCMRAVRMCLYRGAAGFMVHGFRSSWFKGGGDAKLRSTHRATAWMRIREHALPSRCCLYCTARTASRRCRSSEARDSISKRAARSSAVSALPAYGGCSGSACAVVQQKQRMCSASCAAHQEHAVAAAVRGL